MKLSGFPEWLPAQRMVELSVLDTLREVFELSGFASIETRAVEPVSELLRKGETSKEIYLLRRLQEDPMAAAQDPKQLGLHFDLTVPFARYVLGNFSELPFPFRRYQIQKVWRGERPQDGRFREFTQADIDIVGDGQLAFHHEIEVALVMVEALSRLPIPRATLLVNNRKILQGVCEGVGVSDIEVALRNLDKLEKIGSSAVLEAMLAEGIEREGAEKLLDLAQISAADASFVPQVKALGIQNQTLDKGLEELAAVVDACNRVVPGSVRAQLSIARGLDYYTGTVYETVLEGHEDLGSICSGGRYDALASDGKRTFPGVGLSIGVSRLVSRLITQNLVTASRAVPSCVAIAVVDEASRAQSEEIARTLRSRNIPCEVVANAAKFGKQIRYAERRGIPYVWFPDSGEVKDIRSGNQVKADPSTWMPPKEDLEVQILSQN